MRGVAAHITMRMNNQLRYARTEAEMGMDEVDVDEGEQMDDAEDFRFGESFYRRSAGGGG